MKNVFRIRIGLFYKYKSETVFLASRADAKKYLKERGYIKSETESNLWERIGGSDASSYWETIKKIPLISV